MGMWRGLDGGGGATVVIAPGGNLDGTGTVDAPLELGAEFVSRVAALEEAAGGADLPAGLDGQLLGYGAGGALVAVSTGAAGQVARFDAQGRLLLPAAGSSAAPSGAVSWGQLDQAMLTLAATIASLSDQLSDALGRLHQAETAATALAARVTLLEESMPAVAVFDTDLEALGFSNARASNIGFSREVQP